MTRQSNNKTKVHTLFIDGAENQGKIGDDDTKVLKVSGDTEVLDTKKEVNTVGEEVSTAASRTPPTTTVFDDEDVTMAMAQTLINMKEGKAKEKGGAIKDVEVSSKPETEPVEKTKKKVQGDAQIERDVEVALRLQVELDEELKAMIYADYETGLPRMTKEEQEKYQLKKGRLLEEFFERRKKQLAAERAEAIKNKPPTKTQLRNLIMTYLKNIGGYKHSQLKGKSYEEIQGLYERQQKKIQDFTPMDSEKEAQKPEEKAAEYEKEKEELRLSLKIISNDDSEVNYEPLSIKFPIIVYIHGINMLVEKKYPLVKELLEKMLNLQLEAEEESTMAFELIKFIKSLLEEYLRENVGILITTVGANLLCRCSSCLLAAKNKENRIGTNTPLSLGWIRVLGKKLVVLLFGVDQSIITRIVDVDTAYSLKSGYGLLNCQSLGYVV
ncbi:hypothetical protein Tco_0905740 [Tanacetum coccineum]